MPNTAERPNACVSIAPLRSLLPVSTATTRCTGLVWLATACATRGSHAAPSWATITAVTMSWLCVLSGDTYPLAARNGHLRRLQACPLASRQAGARGEQYANHGWAFRQTPKTAAPLPGDPACPNSTDWLLRQPSRSSAHRRGCSLSPGVCRGCDDHDKRVPAGDAASGTTNVSRARG